MPSARPRVIRLVLDANEDEFFFRVGNNGPAVPQELAASIFSPGVSTKGEGRGMGLFIVREVVSSCGGTIECAASGDWTVFSEARCRRKTRGEKRGWRRSCCGQERNRAVFLLRLLGTATPLSSAGLTAARLPL